MGWTAGAGWEYALSDHWTIRFEYLFASFPTTSASGVITGPGGNKSAARLGRPRDSGRPRRRELQVLTPGPNMLAPFSTLHLHHAPLCAAVSGRVAARSFRSEPSCQHIRNQTITGAPPFPCDEPLAALISFLTPPVLALAAMIGLSTNMALACACGCSVFDVGGLDTPQEQDHGGRIFFEFWSGDQTQNYIGSSRGLRRRSIRTRKSIRSGTTSASVTISIAIGG